jgi:hypothetical protein
MYSAYSVSSVEVKPVKFCINCKHFLLKPSFSNPEDGKCSLYPIMKVDKNNLVVGYTSSIDYEKCEVVRISEDMCGEEGKYYEPGDGNNLKKIKFYRRLFKLFPRNDDMEFLKCPSWMI